RLRVHPAILPEAAPARTARLRPARPAAVCVSATPPEIRLGEGVDRGGAGRDDGPSGGNRRGSDRWCGGARAPAGDTHGFVVARASSRPGGLARPVRRLACRVPARGVVAAAVRIGHGAGPLAHGGPVRGALPPPRPGGSLREGALLGVRWL